MNHQFLRQAPADIRVGDHVEAPGLGIGVVTSIWGQYASVDFRGRASHVKLTQLSSREAKERSLQAASEREAARKLEVQAVESKRLEDERRRLLEERRDHLKERLQRFMLDDFMGVDAFFARECSLLLGVKDLNSEKAKFVQKWIANYGSPGQDRLRIPDLEQAAAIGAVQGHVQVVARAGSGKTATLVNRALFLVKHCAVSPAEILLVAFNRKAALEIRRRLLELLGDGARDVLARAMAETALVAEQKGGRNLLDIESDAVDSVAAKLGVHMPHVMTFHALAYAVVHPEERLLFDGPNGEARELSQVVQRVIDDHLQSTSFYARARSLMLAHFRDDLEGLTQGRFDLSKEELLSFRRSLPRESLAGEHVKSHGEKLIADFLFEHDIAYKYERNHWWDGLNYRPDFTIFMTAKSGVVIEYFGLAGSASYDAMSEEKRKYWLGKSDWELIAFYPSDVTRLGRAGFRRAMKSALEALGVACVRLSEDEIWHRVQDRAIGRFAKAVVGFIGRCRQRSWSHRDVANHLAACPAGSDVESMFLELAEEIHAAYLESLLANGEEDFNGLVQRAVEKINGDETRFLRRAGGGDLRTIKFACLDEFQDFSHLFDRLFSAICLRNPGVRMFALGTTGKRSTASQDLTLIFLMVSWRALPALKNWRSRPTTGQRNQSSTLATRSCMGLGRPRSLTIRRMDKFGFVT